MLENDRAAKILVRMSCCLLCTLVQDSNKFIVAETRLSTTRNLRWLSTPLLALLSDNVTLPRISSLRGKFFLVWLWDIFKCHLPEAARRMGYLYFCHGSNLNVAVSISANTTLSPIQFQKQVNNLPVLLFNP
jgi:hypothetical protein